MRGQVFSSRQCLIFGRCCKKNTAGPEVKAEARAVHASAAIFQMWPFRGHNLQSAGPRKAGAPDKPMPGPIGAPNCGGTVLTTLRGGWYAGFSPPRPG